MLPLKDAEVVLAVRMRNDRAGLTAAFVCGCAVHVLNPAWTDDAVANAFTRLCPL